ncbi:MAG: peptidoglycan-binding domain-containing protein, partial [Candidatus Rokuibacteriota bacterium]
VCLTVLGFAPGPVDGAAGPKTMGALQAWAWANFGPSWAQVSTLRLQERLVQQCLAALEALEARPVAKTPARESW